MRSTTGRGLWIVVALGSSAWLVGAPLTAGCGGSGGDVPAEVDSGTTDTGGDGDQLPVCGNGIVEGVEECDDGNKVDGDGCQSDCTRLCCPGGICGPGKPPSPLRGDPKCDDGNACTGTKTCTDGFICSKGTPLADGASCGTKKICKGTVCIDAVCGDGIVTPPEECDDGNTVDGDGCDSCKFSCVSTDTTRNCTSANPCVGAGTCDDAKHVCSKGTPLADGSACGSGKVCKGGVCTGALCGNGVVDPGEECDPPAAGKCDAMCKKIVAAVCGDGVRNTGEQCDDGGTANLDGCDSTCKFEQDHRAISVKMQFATDAYCANNALGGAIKGAAQAQVQKPLDDGIAAGTMNIMFQFLSLSDLTGTAATGISLGAINGKVVTGTGYSGTADLDWWYNPDATSIDASRKPTASLAGSIAAKVLDAGPGSMKLIASFSATPATLNLSNVKVRATIGATSAPKTSTGATPGHLAAEHLDPALVSFATMTNGQLCGNVSAASLSKIPAPAAVLSGGATSCVEGYTATNTLLDVIVGGCRVLGGLITVIVKTQPDGADPGMPVAGAGAPYVLSTGATKSVTTCKDKAGATVTLATCLDAATYSSYFKFGTDRVIIK